MDTPTSFPIWRDVTANHTTPHLVACHGTFKTYIQTFSENSHITVPLIKINNSLNCTLFKVYIKVHKIAFKLCSNKKNTVYSENIIYVKIEHKLLRQNELLENKSVDWVLTESIKYWIPFPQTFKSAIYNKLELYIYQMDLECVWSVCEVRLWKG